LIPTLKLFLQCIIKTELERRKRMIKKKKEREKQGGKRSGKGKMKITANSVFKHAKLTCSFNC